MDNWEEEEPGMSAALAAASLEDEEKEEEDPPTSSNQASGVSTSPRLTRITTHCSDVDLSHMDLSTIPSHYTVPTSSYAPDIVKSLSLDHNLFPAIPRDISTFVNLVALDVSSNSILELPEGICQLEKLRVLLLKNNHLDSNSFPKHFHQLSSLEVLNISGNQFQELPSCILELPLLKALYAGGNQIRSLPCKIGDALSLEILYLGGNSLKEIPATIGKLRNLQSLVLCENRLETIPHTIAHLQRLESLSLHSNALTVLPTEIVTLANLQHLSLRSNPLVARFVRDMTFDPPSLKELAGRIIKIRNIRFDDVLLPRTLLAYLKTAHQCVNPKCKGVYFEARVEHVKFTDFCGKYRIPLMQYLCSPKCSTSPAYAVSESSAEESEAEDSVPQLKLKKVLLG